MTLYIFLGNDVSRTCTELSMNDCQTANQVHYCYCNTDYCNGEKTENIRKRQSHHKHHNRVTISPAMNEDDEDDSESSGMADLNSFENSNVSQDHIQEHEQETKPTVEDTLVVQTTETEVFEQSHLTTTLPSSSGHTSFDTRIFLMMFVCINLIVLRIILV